MGAQVSYGAEDGLDAVSVASASRLATDEDLWLNRSMVKIYNRRGRLQPTVATPGGAVFSIDTDSLGAAYVALAGARVVTSVRSAPVHNAVSQRFLGDAHSILLASPDG